MGGISSNLLPKDSWHQGCSANNIWGAPTPYMNYDVSSNFKPSIKTPGALSTSSQTTYEDDHYQYDWGREALGNNIFSKGNTKENIESQFKKGNENSKTSAHDRSKETGHGGQNSPLNTSGSSITEEIFNTALSNLEFLSDEEPTDYPVSASQAPSSSFVIMSSDIAAANAR